MVVLPVKQRQGDNLVDRHNAGVTQGRWKQVAKPADRPFDSLSRRTAVANQDRLARRDVQGGRPGRQDLHLNRAVGAVLGVQLGRADQFAFLGQFRRDPEFDDLGRPNHQVSRIDGLSQRVPAKAVAWFQILLQGRQIDRHGKRAKLSLQQGVGRVRIFSGRTRGQRLNPPG